MFVDAATFYAASRPGMLSVNAHANRPRKCGAFARSISVQNAGRITSAGVALVVT
jgi:hypothetical protein